MEWGWGSWFRIANENERHEGQCENENESDITNGDGGYSYYESNSDDGPLGSNSKDKTSITRMARLVKGNAYKPRANGSMFLQIGQIFDNVNYFRRVLAKYVI